MNLFKSIQLFLLSALMLSSVVPTVSVAMPISHYPAHQARNKQSQKTSKTGNSRIKQDKKPFWKRINWDNVALGGCALLGIVAFLWAHKDKFDGIVPKQDSTPNSAPQPAYSGQCTICYTNDINMTTPCCERSEDGICRTCWNRPVKSGDYEVDGITVCNKQRDMCPFCRADKERPAPQECTIL